MPHNAIESSPWHTDPGAFPPYAPETERLQFLINYAVLAPSGHNSQPWRFQVRGQEAALYADRSRARRAADPNDRELILSCGAALFNLRVAIRRFGYVCNADLLPDPSDPDLMAVIRLSGRQVPDAVDHRLFDAIPKRHTNRGAFEWRRIAEPLLDQLSEAGRAEGATVEWFQQDGERSLLADLVAEADETHFRDPQYREELSHWVRSSFRPRPDGVPAEALESDGQVASLAGMLPRVSGKARAVGDTHARLIVDAPAVAVVATAMDDPTAWLAAGQALERILLDAAAEGLSASFFNGPIEVPEMRARLQRTLLQGGYPQIAFRLGYAEPAPETPRRAAGDVLKP